MRRRHRGCHLTSITLPVVALNRFFFNSDLVSASTSPLISLVMAAWDLCSISFCCPTRLCFVECQPCRRWGNLIMSSWSAPFPLGQSLLTFGPEFHMYTCMHAFARLIASHHMVKVLDLTAEHCALINARSRIISHILVTCQPKGEQRLS